MSEDPVMRYVEILKKQLAKAEADSKRGWELYHRQAEHACELEHFINLYRKMTGVTIKMYKENEEND